MIKSRHSLFVAIAIALFAAPFAVAPAAAQTGTAPAAAPATAPAEPTPAKPKPKPKPKAKPKPKPTTASGPDHTIYLDTKYGRTTITLRPDLAPKNVAQVEQLTKEGFYNGIVFHRVIEGFMAQTGDPTGTGTGGSKLPNLPAEFTTQAHFVRGTVGMARTDDPNSANSQFFICYAPATNLDGQYTIIGQVTSGMEAIDKLKKGASPDGMVTDPDKIEKMQMANGSGAAPAKKPVKKPVKKIAKPKPAPAPATTPPAPAPAPAPQ